MAESEPQLGLSLLEAMRLQREPWLAKFLQLARIYQAEGYEAAEEWLCKAKG